MAIIRGTSADDSLTGTAEADRILGLAGADLLLGELGADRLFGGTEGDSLYGGRGRDRSFGGAGDDFLADQLAGGAIGPDGDDLFDGGLGVDTVDFQRNDRGVALTLGEGGSLSYASQGAETDAVRGVENVRGSRFADALGGNGLANGINGNGGADRLDGGGGDDSLFAGASLGPLAEVTIAGGEGDDFIIAGRGSLNRVTGGAGADLIFASQDLARERRHVDTVDLGLDRSQDQFTAFGNIEGEGLDPYGFGIDRVSNFRPEDQLVVGVFLAFGASPTTVGDLLDSNADGRVDAADREARLVGRDLLLDVDALLRREALPTLPGGDQHIVLVNVAAFDADQLV